jgi:hypothetical protein
MLVGPFPVIYVIGDKGCAILFGFRVPRKNSEEIVYFLHCLEKQLFSLSFLTFIFFVYFFSLFLV